ncbi:MAG TPA: hypothetical protein PLF41_06790 [Anaerolineales bacterium]|nr:hypothetical protein [Anaerolineales bacterium]
MGIIPARQRQTPPRIRAFQVTLLVLTSIISYGALVLPLIISPATITLQVGDVSPNNYQAPRTLQFESKVRTDDARLAAMKSVAPVYASPDPAIARQQTDRLRAALAQITLIRDNDTIIAEQKFSILDSMSELNLQPETIEQVLALTPTRWESIKEEALSALEQVMRRSIREQDVDTARRSVPSLVSLSFSEEQVALVAELITVFVKPNSALNAELTEAAQQSAMEAVAPIIVEYKIGQIIVLRGQIVTAPQFEALEQFGLIKTETSGRIISARARWC